MCQIHFGGERAEFLTLTLHGPSRPGSLDEWDGNWLRCTAAVHAGAFRGTVDGLLRNEDLARFLPALESLAGQLRGEATFDTLEDWIGIHLTGDGRGQIELRGRLIDMSEPGNALDFRLALDQTYLAPLIAQLRTAADRFPIVGRPRA